MSRPPKIYAFLYEGSAEKFIVRTLHDEGKLKINGTLIGDGFIDRTSNANLTYQGFLRLNLSEKEKRDCTVILVGDKLGKIGLEFFANKEEQEEFENLNAKVYKLSIKPEPEMLFVHHFDIFDSWNKSKRKMDICTFVKKYSKENKINVINRKTIDIKSLTFWELVFEDVEDLIKAINKLNKSNQEQRINNNIKVIGYKDII